MRLNELNLRDFRNYQEESFRFEAGVNLIVGNNAQGKTNLLEAISYVGSGKSFRAQKTSEMVRFGADFADIDAKIFSQNRDQELRYVLFSASRPRQIWRNGSRKKSSGELAGVLPSVLFCPEDLMVLKTGAAARRRLGDHALCDLRPNYEAALTEYNRILDQKNRILKDHFDYPHLLDILPEEIPLERKLEQAIAGALREPVSAHDVARTVRFLCKQGAPLAAMEDVLQSALIVRVTSSMRGALREMYYTMPKWAESRECASLQ